MKRYQAASLPGMSPSHALCAERIYGKGQHRNIFLKQESKSIFLGSAVTKKEPQIIIFFYNH